MEKEKKCNSCKKENFGIKEWGLIIFGFYMLGTSIYGTIQLIKHLMN
jgi:hypothetical protein